MSAVGPLLSEYRKQSRLSQLDLSLLADVSSRHISFIETGKSQPSRSMLLRLADVMDLPLDESNLLLHSGGYAAAFSQLDMSREAMRPVQEALALTLENHNPYPAIVVDGVWNLLMANQSQQLLSARIVGRRPDSSPINLMEAVFREDLFRPHIGNWDKIASQLLRRLRKQVVAYNKAEHETLYRHLLELSPPENWQQPESPDWDGPMLTVDFIMGDLTLSLFSTLSQFGTALDVGMEGLLIESYFPADESTREFFETLAQQM
ncbi:MAG: helix-turn-helix transcriptional regulator [Gammaproteobacteria bacterium]|jgi:transcriptional regulator with XRE-family HTH domain|nr:helix-turn-helix transcriptional regulator [Gammaproteobacteria bacterium]